MKFTYIFLKYHLLLPIISLITLFPKKSIEFSLNLSFSKKIASTTSKATSFEDSIKETCSLASEKLNKFFDTGNISILDISEVSFDNSTSENPAYINALLNLITGDGNMQTNLTTYIKHVKPTVAFIILGFLSIIFWIFCSFFCCCNCCCCCCCKKTTCKNRCYVFALIFNFSFIIPCIIGFFKINKLFIGLGNAECSLLKFIYQIQNGEPKNEMPKWLGFDNISDVFDNISKKINTIRVNNKQTLNDNYISLNESRINFTYILNTTYDYFIYNDDFNNSLKIDVIKEGTTDTHTNAILDLVYDYGPITEEGKFSYNVYNQYKTITEKSEKYLETAHNSFNDILQNGIIDNIINNSKNKINIIKSSIDNMKDKLTGKITTYSQKIDKYGKAIIAIFYIILCGVSILSGITLTCFFSFSTECCFGKCCCGKHFSKTLLHTLWNIQCLLIIITFIFGGIILLISYFGTDLYTVFNFLISPNNLNDPSPKLFGDSSEYLDICFNGDGDLAYLFNITGDGSSSSQLQQLYDLTYDIKEAKENAETNDIYISLLKNKTQDALLLKNVELVDLNDDNSRINLNKLMENFDNLFKDTVYDMWTLTDECTNNSYVLIHLPDNTTNETVIRKNTTDPECLNYAEWENNFTQRYTIPVINTLDIVYYNDIIAATYYVKIVNDIARYVNPVASIVEEDVIEVENAYNILMEKELNSLDIYNESIYDLISVFDQYMGNDDNLFGFLNCKFMGTNFFVTMKYLKESVGNNFKEIGLTFIFAAFLMMLSVAFTILEIIIINVSDYETKRRKEKEEQYNLSTGRVIRFADDQNAVLTGSGKF